MISQLDFIAQDDSKDSIEQNEKNDNTADFSNKFVSTYEQQGDWTNEEVEPGTTGNGGLNFKKFMTLAAMSFLWCVTFAELSYS